MNLPQLPLGDLRYCCNTSGVCLFRSVYIRVHPRLSILPGAAGLSVKILTKISSNF